LRLFSFGGYGLALAALALFFLALSNAPHWKDLEFRSKSVDSSWGLLFSYYIGEPRAKTLVESGDDVEVLLLCGVLSAAPSLYRYPP